MDKTSDELIYLDRLLDLAPIGVITLDESANVLSQNERALAILGTDAETLAGRPLYEHLDTASARELGRMMSRVFNSDTEAKTLLERERPNTRPQFLEMSALLFHSIAGEPRVLLVFQDVTARLEGDRARAEALRIRDEMLDRERKARFDNERQATELLHTNALLETLFMRAPIGLGFWDRKLRFVRVNQALADMNGFPAHEHPGRTIADLLPNMDPAATQLLARVIETGEPLLDQEITGHTPAAPDRIRHWSVSFYPVRLGTEVVGAGAVCQEISGRAPRRDDRTSAGVEDLANITGRDFEEPLKKIHDQARRLLRDAVERTDATAAGIAAGITERTNRMQDMVEDLLAFSTACQTEESVDTNRVFEDVLRDLRPIIDAIPAKVTHDRLPVISRGDRGQIFRLFHSLMREVLSRSHPELPLRIHLEARRDGEFRVFRLHANGESTGARIGPVLWRRIVENHGGRLGRGADADPEAVVTFTLPA